MEVRVNKDLSTEITESTIEVHHRTQAEYEAVAKALREGNRAQRRRHVAEQERRISAVERNRRNAARRVAKQSRKSNKKK